MQALEGRDFEGASSEIGASVPEWMAGELEHFLNFRLAQLAVDPSEREWLGRAIVLTDESGSRRVIGSIGFHGRPDAERRLEIGYSIDPPYRRRGFAREAVHAMLDWAHATHGITRVVASVSPTNDASLALIGQFGFARVGEQMDKIDGLEYVFETTWPRPGAGSA